MTMPGTKLDSGSSDDHEQRRRVPLSVVVVGQTPPPYHGQSIMIQMLLNGKMDGVEMHHVRMAFSENLDQVGRFQMGKIFHLLGLILRIIWARFRYRASVLYYPPAGPNRVPLLRDVAILMATRWLFSKTVFHFQASGASEKIESFPTPLRWLVRYAMRNPSASIQLSQHTVNDAAYLGSKSIFTIPNAAYDEATRLGWTRDKLVSQRHQGIEDPIRILYVGTVCETKGILVLLEACRRLRDNGVRFHLDIVGGFQPARFEDQVRSQICDLTLHECVTVHGQKTGDAKWSMFAAADLFCFPSYYESEGFPCVLVEAMCFCLPIVSTRWRGIPSIVEDGKTGYLSEIQSAGQVADYLTKLIESPELRREMATAARAKYDKELTDSMHIQNMRKVFLSLHDKTHDGLSI